MRHRSSVKRTRHVSRSGQHSVGRWDISLLVVTLILLVIGVIMVYEASVVDAYSQHGDQFHYARLQLIRATFGLGGMIVLGFIPFEYIKKIAFHIFLFSLVLLFLVLIPGIGIQAGGATRWLNLGVFSLQPADISKLAIILYFAALFENSPKLMPFLGSLGVIGGLVMLQPDLGTTIVIATIATILFFLSGGPLKHLFAITSVGIGAGIVLIMTSAYRRARLLTFLNPESDPLGASYHIRQITIALGSGGWFGTGIGRSLQKYRYLPEPTTDSIFAVIAEETGFMGSLVIIGLFLLFAYRGFKLAQEIEDTFMKLVAAGLTMMISLQAFLNLAAMTALVPLTGITLPFISYGGSSLIISLAAVGILLNISRYRMVYAKRR